MSSLTGQTLGRYHILEQLGEGGMAAVYKAYDDLYITQANGYGNSNLTNTSMLSERPSWSESDWIAFNSNNGIEAVRSDGSQRRILVSGGSENWAPAWSR